MRPAPVLSQRITRRYLFSKCNPCFSVNDLPICRAFLTHKLAGANALLVLEIVPLVNGVLPPEIIPFSKSIALELKKSLLNKKPWLKL